MRVRPASGSRLPSSCVAGQPDSAASQAAASQPSFSPRPTYIPRSLTIIAPVPKHPPPSRHARPSQRRPHLAPHPRHWPPLVRAGRHSKLLHQVRRLDGACPPSSTLPSLGTLSPHQNTARVVLTLAFLCSVAPAARRRCHRLDCCPSLLSCCSPCPAGPLLGADLSSLRVPDRSSSSSRSPSPRTRCLRPAREPTRWVPRPRASRRVRPAFSRRRRRGRRLCLACPSCVIR